MAGAVVLLAACTALACGGSSSGNDGASPDGGSTGRGEAGGSSGGDGGTAGDGGASKDSAGGDAAHGDSGGAADSGGTGGEGGTPTGLHVVMGTGGSPGHIVDGSGTTVQLHGADRSGTEYSCLSGAFFDGPVDQKAVDAMKAWHVNAVRVPLNEDCWLGINGVASAYGGTNYQNAIAGWVNLLTQNGMVVILDLHWTAPGATLANAQAPMTDADHSPTFWSQVAAAYKGNGSVIFDLFNEPFITDWTCWVSGGSCAQLNGSSYTVAGMASLLKAVRGTGAQNVVILGGLSYAGDMSEWVSSVQSIPNLPAPLDGIPVDNVAASWHAYDFNSEQSGCPSQYNGYSQSLTCSSAQATATATSATSVLGAGFPLVIGESGISAYSASTAAPFTAAQITDLETWLDDLLTYMETQGQGYLAWSWNTDTPPILLTDYTGTPTPDFGVTYQNHLNKF